MAGLQLLAQQTHPLYVQADAEITYYVPSGVRRGDTLVAAIVSDASEATFVTPTGWTVVLNTLGATNASLALIGKLLDDDDFAGGDGVARLGVLTVSVPGGTKERQGHMFALRGGAPNLVLESSGSAAFTASAIGAPPVASSQQAINFGVAIWSWAGPDAIVLNAAYELLSTYNSNDATDRSIAVGLKVMNATGAAVAMETGTFTGNHTGRAFTLVLRDRPPTTPATLVDPVPGNIGLLGKDYRSVG